MIMKWAPVLLWAGVIFYFSTDTFSSPNTSPILRELVSRLFPNLAAEEINAVDSAFRKFGHWAEYFILSVLLLRAFDTGTRESWKWGWAMWTLVLVLLYAAGDELHQAFVPSRSALVADVLIDFLGGACGVLWMYTLRKRSNARKYDRGDQRRDGS